MNIEISEPQIIVESPFVNEPGVERWGHYQFPTFDRLLDGRIAITFHINRDNACAYGRPTLEPNRGITSDEGRSWEIVRAEAPVAGLLLPNGDRLRVGTADMIPRALREGSYSLPPVCATGIASYGNQPFNCYRHAELPPELQGVPCARMVAGSTVWVKERARLDSPDLMRRTKDDGFLPVVWLGNVHLMADNKLLAVAYHDRIEGLGADSDYVHCGCYRSVDQGLSWQLQTRILYRPDAKADPLAAKRDGFTEPASLILPDGEIVAILRTTDGNGNGPLYLIRSSDGGCVWSPPKAIRENGALPKLLRLGNGVLVLCTGRPGADLTFSVDGRGETWSKRYPLVPIEGPGTQDDSCGNNSIIALDDNSFLVTYSWFKKPAGDGQTRKAILVRRVEVTV